MLSSSINNKIILTNIILLVYKIIAGILRLKKKIKKKIITHYNRILKFIKPDKIHILYKGQIIKSGSKNLALKI